MENPISSVGTNGPLSCWKIRKKEEVFCVPDWSLFNKLLHFNLKLKQILPLLFLYTSKNYKLHNNFYIFDTTGIIIMLKVYKTVLYIVLGDHYNKLQPLHNNCVFILLK